MAQTSPIRIEASEVGTSKPATVIFLHGYGDDADGWTDIARQFQAAHKLPHLTWIFPTAPFNHEAMTTAWYTPTEFSPIPVGRSSSSSTDVADDDETFAEEHHVEILASVDFVCDLIDDEVRKGVDPRRIVLAGFSQGCAIALLAGLAGRSRWRGKVSGVVGLSGYLPRGKEIWQGDESGAMDVFLAHGTKDMMVPLRVFKDARARVERIVGNEKVEAHVYPGLGHNTSGEEFRDMCRFLERIVAG